MLRGFFSIFIIFLCLGCQTVSDLVLFKKIQLGTTKGDVVELLGSPADQERKDDRDWWYYTFYEAGLRFNRMVVFENGKVIYAGRVATPEKNKPLPPPAPQVAPTQSTTPIVTEPVTSAPITLPRIIPDEKSVQKEDKK